MQINPKNKPRGGKQVKNERTKAGGKEKDGGREKKDDGSHYSA